MGAAIAAGSHLEKGIWALLVIAAIIIVNTCINSILLWCIMVMFQCPWFSVMAIARSNITSPIRFVKAVIIPAPSDFEF